MVCEYRCYGAHTLTMETICVPVGDGGEPVIANCTPHDICIDMGEKGRLVIERQPPCIRAISAPVEPVDNPYDTKGLCIPIVSEHKFTGIDEKSVEFVKSHPNKMIIASMVSAKVLADTFKGRAFFHPDTGPDSVVRDETGRITGSKRLCMCIVEEDKEPSAKKGKK